MKRAVMCNMCRLERFVFGIWKPLLILALRQARCVSARWWYVEFITVGTAELPASVFSAAYWACVPSAVRWFPNRQQLTRRHYSHLGLSCWARATIVSELRHVGTHHRIVDTVVFRWANHYHDIQQWTQSAWNSTEKAQRNVFGCCSKLFLWWRSHSFVCWTVRSGDIGSIRSKISWCKSLD